MSSRSGIHRDGIIPPRPTIAQSRAKLELIQDQLNQQEATRLPLEKLQQADGEYVTKPPATTERTIRLRAHPMRNSQENSDSSESDEDIELKSDQSSHSSTSSDDETPPEQVANPSQPPAFAASSSSSFTPHRTSISQRRASAETFTHKQKSMYNDTNRSVSDASKRSTMPLPSTLSARGANMLAFSSSSSSSTPQQDCSPLQPAALSDYVEFDSWQSVDSCDPYGSQSELFNPDGSRKPVLAINMLHRMIGLGVSQRVEGAETLGNTESFNIQPSHQQAASELLYQSQQVSPQNVRLYSRIKTRTDPSRATTARTARTSKPPSTVYRVNDEGEPI